MSMGGGQSQTGAPQTSSTNQSQNTSQNNTTNMGPWSSQQPFLSTGFGNAQALLNNNSTMLAPNPTLSASWDAMTNAAKNTPQFLGQGNNYLSNVLSGANLSPNSNPYLAQSVQAAMQPIMNNYQTAIAPGLDSNAEMANRYGSGAAQQQKNQANTTLATALGNTSANMYSGAYNQGIQQQENAAGQIPAQLAANYAPSMMMNQSGQQQQQYQQLAQQYPWLTAQMYQGLVGGNYGQSGNSNMTGNMTGNSFGMGQQSYFSNPFGQAAGAGLAGLGTAGQLGFSPFGAGAGAAGGAAAGGVTAAAAPAGGFLGGIGADGLGSLIPLAAAA